MKSAARDRTRPCRLGRDGRDGAGPDTDILIDLNFNARPEGRLKLLRAIADLDLFWVGIDLHNPRALAYVRERSPHPILPCLEAQAMDVAIVDAASAP